MIGGALVGVKVKKFNANKIESGFTQVVNDQNLNSEIINLYYDEQSFLKPKQLKEVTEFIESTSNLEQYDINETSMEDYWDNF